jgi:hypothetical protein
VGGGTCSNISCHQIRGIGTTRIWGGVQPSATSMTCINTNAACGEELCQVVNPYGGTAPYTFLWQFANGATGTTQSLLHTFTPGEPLSVTVTIRDANLHAATIAASVQTPVFSSSLCPMGVSSPPILSDTITNSGSTFPSLVTITDNSVVCDNQWHTGSAVYQEYMMVLWGDGTSNSLSYTIGNGAPATQIFTHTYTAPRSNGTRYTPCVYVRDKYGSVAQRCYDAGI